MRRRREFMGMQSPPKVLYEGYNLSFDKTEGTVINTGVYLFTQENINRDFEFVAEGIWGPASGNDTIICAKHNGNAYGFLVRTSASTDASYKGTISTKKTIQSTVIVRRVNGVITVTGENITNPGVQFINGVFNWPLVLGCAIDDNGSMYRYAQGTIEHVKVKWL